MRPTVASEVRILPLSAIPPWNARKEMKVTPVENGSHAGAKQHAAGGLEISRSLTITDQFLD
jgi:hypothetical protein